jgi:glycosyltransferase involved in cell wall biosynthesis
MIKIAHIITGLTTGGAEVQLLRILSGINQQRFKLMVISLGSDTPIANDIRKLGIPVHSLDLKKNPFALLKTIKLLKKFSPDAIHATMYHANLVGSIFRYFLPGRVPVIWAIHHPLENIQADKLLSRAIIHLGAKLSGKPQKIIYVSHTNAKQHHNIGYCKHHDLIMPNGINVENNKPDHAAGLAIRQELGVTDEQILIGKIARYHPQKNHFGLLRAAAILCEKHTNVRFVLAGDNLDNNNTELMSEINKLGLSEKIHLLGRRQDVAAINNALDIGTLTSHGEAFPLALVEAMASETPCVATDVGDVAYAIGKTGIIVPPRNINAMVEAWDKMIEMGDAKRKELGRMARLRCIQYFTLAEQVKCHEEMYQTLSDKELKEGTCGTW